MRTVNIDDLSDAIMEELTLYHQSIDDGIKKVVNECSNQFVKDTKRDAPRGARQKFYKNIARKNVVNKPHAYTDVWYVKDPEYRLTHLIKNGHATRDGGRTKAQDFITPNYEKMEKKLENGIKEVIESGR